MTQADYLAALSGNLATRRAQLVTINTTMPTIVNAIAAYRQMNDTLWQGAKSTRTLSTPASDAAMGPLYASIKGGLSSDLAATLAAALLRAAGSIPVAASVPGGDPLVLEDQLAAQLTASLPNYFKLVGA